MTIWHLDISRPVRDLILILDVTINALDSTHPDPDTILILNMTVIFDATQQLTENTQIVSFFQNGLFLNRGSDTGICN